VLRCLSTWSFNLSVVAEVNLMRARGTRAFGYLRTNTDCFPHTYTKFQVSADSEDIYAGFLNADFSVVSVFRWA